MGWKRVAFETATKGVIRVLGLNGSSRAAAEFASLIEPVYVAQIGGQRVKFASAGIWPHYRARTLLTKEPETIEWLNGIEPDEVVYDIGANVGIYTCYAAMIRGCRVVACEPSAVNHAALVRNLELNGINERVIPLCVALSDRGGVDRLHMRTTAIGGALASFGQPIDERGRPYTPIFRQAVIGLTLDELIARYGLPFPHHIKIDVDGFEDRVMRGAGQILRDPRLRSLLVELRVDSEHQQRTIQLMASVGYAVSSRLQAAGTGRHGNAAPHNRLVLFEPRQR